MNELIFGGRNMIKASFGKVNISPEEIVSLQGYHPDKTFANPETDLMDELYARIVILESASIRTVIISIDSCLSNEQLFTVFKADGSYQSYTSFRPTFAEGTYLEWAKAAGVEEEFLSVHATHTHTAPETLNPGLTKKITDKISELAANLIPVKVFSAQGECSISVNRRPLLQHNDTLPIDRSLHMIWFESEDGIPLGSMINCAVHPTQLLNPYSRISSEMVGLAMGAWEQRIGGQFVSLFLQGFSGDVGPRGHYRTETEDTYPRVLRMSEELLEDIVKTSAEKRQLMDESLQVLERTILLPARETYISREIPILLKAMKVSEVIVLSSSSEVFNGYVDEIGSAFPELQIVFCGIANGYTGYLPTVSAFKDDLGGYEMFASPYSPEAAPLFINACVELIGSLLEVNE